MNQELLIAISQTLTMKGFRITLPEQEFLRDATKDAPGDSLLEVFQFFHVSDRSHRPHADEKGTMVITEQQVILLHKDRSESMRRPVDLSQDFQRRSSVTAVIYSQIQDPPEDSKKPLPPRLWHVTRARTIKMLRGDFYKAVTILCPPGPH